MVWSLLRRFLFWIVCVYVFGKFTALLDMFLPSPATILSSVLIGVGICEWIVRSRKRGPVRLDIPRSNGMEYV